MRYAVAFETATASTTRGIPNIPIIMLSAKAETPIACAASPAAPTTM